MSASGRSHLDLLTARVRDQLRGEDSVRTTLDKLGAVCDDKKDLFAYSDALGLPRPFWSADGPLADNAAAFLAEVQRRPGKLEELVHLLAVRYPEVQPD